MQDRPALDVLPRNFFALLRTLTMEPASTSNPNELTASQGRNKNSSRPFPMILTSPVNIISFQQDMKPIVQYKFSLRTTGTGIRIVNHLMAGWAMVINIIQMTTKCPSPY
jgi:hypothetical protein